MQKTQPKSLILMRHGQSVWNQKNLFTGFTDVELTQKGMDEAIHGALLIQKTNIKLKYGFTSKLKRAIHTMDIIVKTINLDIEIKQDAALNERDYGELTGLNKDEAKKKWGEEKIQLWRRSFDVAPPKGESLKMTAKRVLPYFHKNIEPILQKHDVIIVAHGNSLRAIVMFIENLSAKQILQYEIPTGKPLIYKTTTNDKYRTDF